MELKNQKNDHVVILTSDAEDASVKKYRFKPWMVWTVVILVCVIIGALLGYIAYEERIWEAANQKIEEYKTQLDESKSENEALRMEIEGLNSKITVLSDTITQMKAIETDLTARLDKIATPTMLPITGSATIREVTEGDPMSVFMAAEGAVVVATAGGVVLEIGEDTEFGHRVVIDHGNGYVTIYRYQSDPLVATGDSVAQGGTLYVINEEDTELGYQIMKDEVYVAPSAMMEIMG